MLGLGELPSTVPICVSRVVAFERCGETSMNQPTPTTTRTASTLNASATGPLIFFIISAPHSRRR